MSNYPDGVTAAMIDRAVGATDDIEWPFELECDHEGTASSVIDALEAFFPVTQAGVFTDKIDALFEQAPRSFTPDEVGEIDAWADGTALRCTWRCPVCAEQHELERDAGDLRDDD